MNIKNITSTPATWRWHKEDFYAPFDQNEAPSNTSKGNSTYTKGYGKASTAMQTSALVVRALQRLSAIVNHKGYGGIAENGDMVAVEAVSMQSSALVKELTEEIPDDCCRIRVIYDPSTGKFQSQAICAGRTSSPTFAGIEDIFMIPVIWAARHDRELDENLTKYLNDQPEALFKSSYADEVTAEAYIISNNIYARDSKFALIDSVNPGAGIKTDLSSIGNIEEDLSEWKVVAGTFDGRSKEPGSGSVHAPRCVGIADMKGMYAFSERELDEFEKELVPVLDSTCQVTERAHLIARLIRDSTGMPTEKRNFLFIGEGGSGKSELCKIEANLCNKPLLHQSIDPDSDKFDICQMVIPDGCGGFTYVESPLIEAIEKGWFVEVSEADLILKQGALGYLNPLFDKTATMQLNTGRIVKRHPEAVVFFTINATYEGCRGLNQAVRDRLKPFMFETPDDDTLIERVMNESGLNDRGIVEKMVKVLHAVKDHCATNMVEDGVVGVRSLIDWASDVALGIPAWTSAMESIIYRWNPDCSEHAAIKRCIETQFVPEEVELP